MKYRIVLNKSEPPSLSNISFREYLNEIIRNTFISPYKEVYNKQYCLLNNKIIKDGETLMNIGTLERHKSYICPSFGNIKKPSLQDIRNAFSESDK